MRRLRDWFRKRRTTQDSAGVATWFRVTWDSEQVHLDVEPPGRSPWEASFTWSSVCRVCFKAEGLEASDGIYVFTTLRPESFAIPTEASGGTALWNEIVKRGLFSAALAVTAASAADGTFCWPPLERTEGTE
jgi:hypothetical protein